MTNNTLKIGSIIHLESAEPDWGYLNMLGWTTDIPVITFFQDSTIRAVITTHTQKDRVTHSGSWQILSANNEKNLGDELKNGDKIYLLNMVSGVGYLDTFEHVFRLEPFASYSSDMKIGVFTANVPNRGGGVSGTWVIHSQPTDPSRDTIKENDTIRLENEYPGAGFLFAYADSENDTVPKHLYQKNNQEIKLFEEYPDAKKFVFTGGAEKNNNDNSSYEWKISSVTVSNFAKSLYRIENQWGSNHTDDDKTPWHDVGIFKISDGKEGRVVSLTWKGDEESRKFSGNVEFKGVDEDNRTYTFTASPLKDQSASQNDLFSSTQYEVNLLINGVSTKQEWVIGSRSSQRVINLTIPKTNQSADDIAFEGTIQYEGEKSIGIRGLAPTDNNPDHDIQYDFYNPDLLRGRAQKMRGVVDTTYKMLSNVKKELKGYLTFDDLDEKKKVDFEFQERQLTHLQLLSDKLNDFYRDQLKPLMKQAYKGYRDDQTLAPHHIVRRCFQNMAIDHEIIQRATIQRRWTHGQNVSGGAFMSEQAMELLVMDKLAIKALKPFSGLLQTEANKLAVLTYLSDKTHIRHVPYSDQLILVGVSYDRVPQVGILFDNKSLAGDPFYAFELMAIPHEIAHYVYKYGKVAINGNNRSFPEISKQFEGVNPYYRWCEEIFADLYGCIIAGPLTVLSMQALLVSIDRDRAWKDDHEHPTPVLRLFILNEMLRILNDVAEKVFDSDSDPDNKKKRERFDFHNLPDLLDENWTETVGKWGFRDIESLYLSDIFVTAKQKNKRPARIYQHDQSAIHLDQIVNVDRFISTVRPIIVEFATHLLTHGDFAIQAGNGLENPLTFDNPWVKVDSDIDLQKALGNFNQSMRKLTNREFARKTTENPKLNEGVIQDKPKKSIQEYLEGWGEHGPSGGSGGTHF